MAIKQKDAWPAGLIKAPGCRAGFTTVELLVTMALLLVVGALALITYQVASDARNSALARIDIAEKSRVTLDIMSREIGSAYINPTGLLGQPPNEAWRWQKYPGYPYENPRNFVDDDGDGLVDEVEITMVGVDGQRGDGIDNDGDGAIDEERADYVDNDGDGLIDEDCTFPDDMINFVMPADVMTIPVNLSTDPTLQGSDPVLDLVEVGYALDAEFDRLRRRFVPATRQFDGRFPQALDPDGREAFTQESEIMAFDILGLNIRYYFYDYQLAALMNENNWSLSQAFSYIGAEIDPDPLPHPDGSPRTVYRYPVTLDTSGNRAFVYYPFRNTPWAYMNEWHSDRQDLPVAPYSQFQNINNEPADVVNNQAALDGLGTPVGDPLPADLVKYNDERTRETDGLPHMVEITVIAVDRRRDFSIPTQYTTRVHISQR
jgi:type II secretory pathway pseudopilin PulG